MKKEEVPIQKEKNSNSDFKMLDCNVFVLFLGVSCAKQEY